MHKERLFVGDSGRSGICCKICDRKFILYIRYQQYAREIGIKDQLIQERTSRVNEATQEVRQKLQAIGKLQQELAGEQTRYGNFEYQTKQRILEIDVRVDHYEGDIDQMKSQILNKERDLDYKCLEQQTLALEVQKSERVIGQAQTQLVT